MADNENHASHGVYVKGDKVAVANSRARAIALEFDGYTKQSDESTEDVEELDASNPDAPETDDDDSGAPAGVNVTPSTVFSSTFNS